MIRRYLDNYKAFKCIAAHCPDTCCNGWLIEIDETSLERFENISKIDSDFGKRVNFSEGCFFQSETKDCSFLLGNGLCKMQKEYGEDMLCYTCDMYPRHVEEFPNVREYSLSASCPVVAKNIVAMREYLSFAEETDDVLDQDSIEEYEDYNELLYDKLLDIRTRLVVLLKGEGAFEEKAQRILDSMSVIQENLDIGIYDGIEEAFGEMHGKAEYSLGSSLESYIQEIHTMRTLEILNEKFVVWMRSKENTIKSRFQVDKINLEKQYDEYEVNFPQMDLIQCNIALYFLFTYFCGAVYDNYVYSAVKLAIYSARVIKSLSFAQWIEDDNVDIASIVYNYCREVEHSNENINKIKQELDL